MAKATAATAKANSEAASTAETRATAFVATARVPQADCYAIAPHWFNSSMPVQQTLALSTGSS